MILAQQKFEDGYGSARHGYYTVGDKNFYHKINAIFYASSTNLPISWEFNRQQFASQAVKPRMQISLLELYRLRAQQLRDHYDYVILAYSGGSDSDAILKAFVNNNIKLDEVWFDQPFKFIEKTNYRPNLSTAPENLASEWYYVVKPELEQLRVTNPEIKIHCSDSCEDPELEDYDDTHQYTMAMTYNGIRRWRYIKKYVEQLEARQKTVCVILGIDKCIPSFHKGQYGFMFSDVPTFIKQPFVEYFYWTPDMPEIVIQQCHELWDNLRLHPKIIVEKTNRMQANPLDWANRDAYDGFIKSVIYPQWDLAKHQVDKQCMFLGQGYRIFVDRWHQEKFYQSWYSNLKHTISQIDPAVAWTNEKNLSSDIKSFKNQHFLGTFS